MSNLGNILSLLTSPLLTCTAALGFIMWHKLEKGAENKDI